MPILALTDNCLYLIISVYDTLDATLDVTKNVTMQGVDWREPANWACNNNVHPSRHGTYDGIAFHPYETVFVKSSWHVAEPYTRRYTVWAEAHLAGEAGTAGRFDYTKHRYAIRCAA